MKRLAYLLLIVAVATNARATETTVTFEGVPVEYELQVLPGGVFEGMRFMERPTLGALHLTGTGDCSAGCSASGSTSLGFEGYHLYGQPPLVISQSRGLAFRLLSLDAAELFSPGLFSDDYNASSIRLVGHLANGFVTETLLDLDGITDGPGGVADFQTFAAPLGDALFVRLLLWGVRADGGQVPLTSAGFAVDNLAFDVDGPHVEFTALNVPEPAALVLVGLAAIFGLTMGERR